MTARLGDAPHVLVTGAAGAIGGATARALRQRRPRARLTLADLDGAGAERLGRELGGEVAVEACDLGTAAAARALHARAAARLGPLDGLVSSAGLMQVRALERMPWDAAEHLLLVDLVAPLALLHAAAGAMAARGAGFVVNVSSMAGRVPLKGCAFYGAAKAGLAMASEIAHAELASRGVHVVTVYPGPVRSALEAGARAEYRPGLLTRHVPTGDAPTLARHIVDAVERGRARVVYPAVYALGYRALGLASRVALRLGPEPRA